MDLATWNVLHRVHAENWREPCILAWPDERARARAIAEAVAGMAAEGLAVVCLQEVSGDQLQAIQARLPAAAVALVHRYGRLPRLRDGRPSSLADAHEHLVTVVTDGHAVVAAAEDPPTDRGKGFLAVDLVSGLRVVNTHVSHGEPGVGQMARLASVAREAGRAVILGDFNADHRGVAPCFGEPFAVAARLGDSVTRVGTPPRPGRWIDHAVGLGGSVEAVSVTDALGRSDHHALRVRWRDGAPFLR